MLKTLTLLAWHVMGRRLQVSVITYAVGNWNWLSAFLTWLNKCRKASMRTTYDKVLLSQWPFFEQALIQLNLSYCA